MRELEENVHVCPYCGFSDGQPPQEDYFLYPGTILQNRYVVGKAIGNGGFGITYLGYDLMLTRRIAIKEYYPKSLAARGSGTEKVSVYTGESQAQYRMGLDSFISEAKKLAEFTKIPEVVDVYDCVLINNTGYIIMEYIKGQTVKEILDQRERYPYEEARDLILNVLRGLIPIHKAGIIHRDISPDNIMVTDDGQVKVIDFGASRQVLANRSLNYSIILKPGYAPIEQYSTNGRQGPWTDVYALGCTFYRMITGQKPDESLDRLEEDTLKRPSEMGVAITRRQEAVLLKSMAIRREDRYQDTEEFAEALLNEKTITGGGTGIIKTPPGPDGDPSGIGMPQIVMMGLSYLAVTALVAILVLFGLENTVGRKQSNASPEARIAVTWEADESDRV